MIELTAGELIASISVLFLSVFLGFELISKVPPTLHTPLMSGANAISGIAIVGALFAANERLGQGETGWAELDVLDVRRGYIVVAFEVEPRF